MKSEFVDLLAAFVREAEPDLTFRLETQAEELDNLPCTEPAIGKWVDAHDVEFMLAAFALDDDDFAAEFPGIAKLSQQDRQRIIKAFEDHFQQCAHCGRKQSYDHEFNSRVDAVVQNNRTNLLEYLHQQTPEGSAAEEEDHDLTLHTALNK
jgi:hypothetical protein